MENPKTYRQLESKEIAVLQDNGCKADSWDNIRVIADFLPDNIANCKFEGKITLEISSSVIDNQKYSSNRTPGIRNARIINSKIGNSYICNIWNCIKNADISDNVIIENCGLIYSDEKSNQENAIIKIWDTRIPVINTLTLAETCFLIALSQKDSSISEKIEPNRLSETYIGGHSILTNCTEICNSRIEEGCFLTNVTKIKNSFLTSDSMSETYIMDNAIIENSRIGKGCLIAKNTIIENCIVYEHCRIMDNSICTGSLIPEGCNIMNTYAKNSILAEKSVMECDKIFNHKTSAFEQLNTSEKTSSIEHFPYEDIYIDDNMRINAPGKLFFEQISDRYLANNNKSESTFFGLTPGRIIELEKSFNYLDDLMANAKEEIITAGNNNFLKNEIIDACNLYDTLIDFYISANIISKVYSLLNTDSDNSLIEDLVTSPLRQTGAWLDFYGKEIPENLMAEILDKFSTLNTISASDISKEFSKIGETVKSHEWAFIIDTWLSELPKEKNEVTLHDIQSCAVNMENSAKKLAELFKQWVLLHNESDQDMIQNDYSQFMKCIDDILDKSSVVKRETEELIKI